MGDQSAFPQLADHADRLLEHLEPFLVAGPPVAQDVLVQILARPHAEEEAAGHELRARRGRLRDDRRVQAHRRARDSRTQDQRVGRLRDCADRAPHEWALALGVQPRMEVIGDEREAEARLLGTTRIGDELGRRQLLR